MLTSGRLLLVLTAEKNMFHRLIKLLALTVSMNGYSSAHALLVYDELVSGDLPDLNMPIPVFVASVGGNEVYGEFGLYPDTANSFVIDLRGGFRLDSIMLTRFPVPTNGYALGFNILYADSVHHLSLEPVHLGMDILPLLNLTTGPGIPLPLENDLIGIALLQTLSRDAYCFDFVVSQVPMPPALWLFLSGILGLICVGSRPNTDKPSSRQ